MRRIAKIILSIPTVFGAFILVTLFIPDLKNWITKISNTESQGIILIFLIAIQEIVLIFRIWTFKNIKTSKKAENTFFLIGFNIVAGFIYIWKTDDYFIKLNQTKKQPH